MTAQIQKTADIKAEQENVNSQIPTETEAQLKSRERDMKKERQVRERERERERRSVVCSPPSLIDANTRLLHSLPPSLPQQHNTSNNPQREYRAILDAQVQHSGDASPQRILLRKSKFEGSDDVEVVPTTLKDRPW